MSMTAAPLAELFAAVSKLATLQLRLSLIATEATVAIARAAARTGNKKGEAEFSQIEIDAAAGAIEAKLLNGYELGFRCLLRNNFPRDAIRETAAAALIAAHEARHPGSCRSALDCDAPNHLLLSPGKVTRNEILAEYYLRAAGRRHGVD